ncbi:MAG TPA: class I SAM-dependent methyltransferase [Gaiellales bacterium]|nr:class I SAM-dependent methyltransferase [Gaiellales bacterium]
MLEYYDRRAPEYDQWYMGTGLFAERDRPGWHEELRDLCAAVAALPPATTVDVACGTGFLTRHLRGAVTGLDQSPQMLEIARERIPGGRVVQGEAMPLPFEDGSFDRVFTGHFYGHLRPDERERFVAEALRVARELVVVDSHLRPDHDAEEEQERGLNDGSVHTVYKRYFTGAGLAAELGGGAVLHDGDWFVMVRVSAPTSAPSA